MMKRIFLFLATNLLIMVSINLVLWAVEHFLGIPVYGAQWSGLMILCLAWGMGGAFISLMLSKVMAKWTMGLQILDPNVVISGPYANLIQTVHRLARHAGLPEMPEVGIYESSEVNAFATGPSKSNSLVAVSTGLLDRMSQDEVEGVLGHEIAHIANGDMVTMTLIQGVVNAFVMFFARVIGRLLASQVEERNRHWVQFLAVFVLDILFGILGSIVVFYFSRQREFRADAGGAQYAGKSKMIHALERLQGYVEGIDDENKGLATLKISGKPSGILALFSTHPSLDERILRLKTEV